MENRTEIAPGKWSVPQCPFEIEYSLRVLDDIRLLVVDAFFCLPRGGAEIGGILLGQWSADHLAITGFEPLHCEHAMGPSFTLSSRDQTHMAELISAARRNEPNRQPVGWYHSHTRTEIFLSDADLAIHNRFFPEPWQIALVLKPHAFEPTRAGFFFRPANGPMRREASYQEFRLDPMPLRSKGEPLNAPPQPNLPRQTELEVRANTEEAQPDFPPDPPKPRVPITREIAVDQPGDKPESPASESQSSPIVIPSFTQPKPTGSGRAVKAIFLVAIGLLLGAMGYQTRQYWAPRLITKLLAVMPKEPNPYLALAVSDDNGQLKIQWDRNSPAVRTALEATLQITDGTAVQSVLLDGAQLASGGFTYARQTERVDVTLSASGPERRVVKEQTSFLGQLPVRAGAPEDRDAEAQRADKLQKDLNFQAAKTRKLEKDLKDMQQRIEKSKQTPDPPKN